MKRSLLENYSHTQELLRELKKEQDKIRAEIIAQMNESVESVGDFVVILSECERSSIDKTALIEDHGVDFVSEYTKITSYKKLEVKKAAWPIDSPLQQFTDELF